jgi:hypothetical protein
MTVIGITALAFFAFRVDLADPRVHRIWHEYIIGIVPMAGMLTYGALIGCCDVLRRGRCHPFLVGFEMFGWGSLFAYASFMAVNFENNTRPLDWLDPLTRYVFGGELIIYDAPSVMTFHVFVLNLPELAVALIGGWLTSSLSVILARTLEAAESPDRREEWKR